MWRRSPTSMAPAVSRMGANRKWVRNFGLGQPNGIAFDAEVNFDSSVIRLIENQFVEHGNRD